MRFFIQRRSEDMPRGVYLAPEEWEYADGAVRPIGPAPALPPEIEAAVIAGLESPTLERIELFGVRWRVVLMVPSHGDVRGRT